MATRLGAAAPLRSAVRAVAKQSVLSLQIRQFTCTAIRTKDVASQEDVPNMRHAQRPRKDRSFLWL